MPFVTLEIFLIIIVTIIVIAVIKIYDSEGYDKKSRTDEYRKREETMENITDNVKGSAKTIFIILGLTVLGLVFSVIAVKVIPKIGDALVEGILQSLFESCMGPGQHECSCA